MIYFGLPENAECKLVEFVVAFKVQIIQFVCSNIDNKQSELKSIELALLRISVPLDWVKEGWILNNSRLLDDKETIENMLFWY